MIQVFIQHYSQHKRECRPFLFYEEIILVCVIIPRISTNHYLSYVIHRQWTIILSMSSPWYIQITHTMYICVFCEHLPVYLKSYPRLYFHRYFTWQGFPFYQMRSFSRHHHLSMASRTIEQRRTILLSNLGFVCFIGKRKNNTTNTKRQMKKGDGNFIAHIFTYFLLIVITVIWDFLLFKCKELLLVPIICTWRRFLFTCKLFIYLLHYARPPQPSLIEKVVPGENNQLIHFYHHNPLHRETTGNLSFWSGRVF